MRHILIFFLSKCGAQFVVISAENNYLRLYRCRQQQYIEDKISVHPRKQLISRSACLPSSVNKPISCDYKREYTIYHQGKKHMFLKSCSLNKKQRYLSMSRSVVTRRGFFLDIASYMYVILTRVVTKCFLAREFEIYALPF